MDLSLIHCLAAFAVLFASPSSSTSPPSTPAHRSSSSLPHAKHVVPLRRTTSEPQLRRRSIFSRQDDAADNEDDNDLAPPAVGFGRVLDDSFGLAYISEVTIAGTTLSLITHTGSSDTWVAGEDFACYELTFDRDGRLVDACMLGPLFEGELPGGEVEGHNFVITYGFTLGPVVWGKYGFADTCVAGIEVPNLQVGLAEGGAWPGDNITSGVLGLGLRALTQSIDENGDAATYAPLVEAMQDHDIPAVFSLGLSRNDGASFLALGGVPDHVVTGDFAVAPIVPTEDGTYVRYDVQPSRLVVNNTDRSAFSDELPVMLVDNGSTLTFLPHHCADAINSLFVPEASFNFNTGTYETDCDAIPPSLGFDFGDDKVVWNVPEYMILTEYRNAATGLCPTGIMASANETFGILGLPFMQGRVVVYDIEEDAMEIRFAEWL